MITVVLVLTVDSRTNFANLVGYPKTVVEKKQQTTTEAGRISLNRRHGGSDCDEGFPLGALRLDSGLFTSGDGVLWNLMLGTGDIPWWRGQDMFAARIRFRRWVTGHHLATYLRVNTLGYLWVGSCRSKACGQRGSGSGHSADSTTERPGRLRPRATHGVNWDLITILGREAGLCFAAGMQWHGLLTAGIYTRGVLLTAGSQ